MNLLNRLAAVCLALPCLAASVRAETYDARVHGPQILTPPSGPAPAINGPDVYGVRPGRPVIYRIPTTGSRPIRFIAKGLPATLRIDEANGIVTGHAPANAGHHVVTFRAENDQGKDERKLTFVVGDKLALTPPMGWNHWYTHYLNITDSIIRNAADEMVKSGMADVGYHTFLLSALTPPGSGFAQTSKPLAERQQEFLWWKFGMFICCGLATFNEGQWATGYEDPGTFAPTQLDCSQWADAAKAAGMKYAVFTTKHTSGYALWDSKHTTHDITAFTNFRQGKGDLVREFVDAFRAREIKVGLYYCLPGDYSKNKLQPGQTDLHGLPPDAAGDYVKFIKLQLTELLTQYGAVDLMWFDQYENKYTGKQWLEIKAHVHSLQPDCLVLANNSTNFKETDIHGYEYPWLKDKKRKALPSENNTNAAEVCDCITPGAWYWQPNLTEKSVTSTAEVVDMLKLCNSRQANYLLNVPPDRTGRIPEWLVRRLAEIGQEWQSPKPERPELK